MKNIIFLIIILTLISLSITGCYDSTSLEKFHYVIALAIDTSEKSNILLSVQIAKSNSTESASSNQSTQNLIYSVDCESIETGLNIINNYLSKKINLSHCSAIIFSEELAKKGVSSFINELANNPEIRSDSHILICNSKGLDVLENISKSGESFSSRYYDFVINSIEASGYSSKSQFIKFFYSINTPYEVPIANYIILNNEVIQNIGIAVFKDDKYDYHLSPLESLAHLIVNNQLKESIITLPNPYNPGTSINIKIKNDNKKTETSAYLINNKPHIDTKIEISGTIIDIPFNYNDTNFSIFERELNNYIKQIVSDYYKLTIQNNSDLENIAKKLSNKFLTINSYNKIDWNEMYKETTFDISVNSKISKGIYTKK